MNQPMIDRIFRVVKERYGFTQDELRPKHIRKLDRARHIAVYMLRSLTNLKCREVGALVSRDHSAVRTSLAWVERKQLHLPGFNAEIRSLRVQLRNESADAALAS